MQQMIETVQRSLPEGSVELNRTVSSIHREGDRWRVETNKGPIRADGVIVALPARSTAQLLGAVDAGLQREVGSIPVSSSATLNLVYRTEDLPNVVEGYGFVCPAVEGRSLLACTFTSRKYEGRSDDRHTILRAFVGGSGGGPAMKLPDADLESAVLRDLRGLMGLTATPLLSRLRRYDGVFPQYLKGHLDRVGLRASLPAVGCSQ